MILKMSCVAIHGLKNPDLWGKTEGCRVGGGRLEGEDVGMWQHGRVLGILVGRVDVDNQAEWARFGYQISNTHGASRNHIAY